MPRSPRRSPIPRCARSCATRGSRCAAPRPRSSRSRRASSSPAMRASSRKPASRARDVDQAQASNVSLATGERIEVLRGPLALLYGNAAGGVVQVFTQAGAPEPTATLSASAAPYDAHRVGASFAAASGEHRYTIDASRFETDGYRDHSAARRDHVNAKWSCQPPPATRLDTVVNVLDEPDALDPLRLTRAQWEASPRQAPAIAFTQDSGKSVRQKQAGWVLEHALASDTTLTARAYLGERDLHHQLSTPLAAQLPASSSGGVRVVERP